MKTLQVGFSKPKNKCLPIGSWLIRLYQRSAYSHVYLKFYGKSINRWLVYEAVGNGVRFIGSTMWEKHAEEVDSFTLDVEDELYTKIMQYCVDHAGIEYGFMQNIGIAIARLFKMNNNPFRKGKNCSEAIGEVLELKGYQIDKPLDLMTPKDVYNVLTN